MRRVVHVINVCDASIRKRYPWNVYLGEEQNLEDSLQPTHGPSIYSDACYFDYSRECHSAIPQKLQHVESEPLGRLGMQEDLSTNPLYLYGRGCMIYIIC